jgi:hypothetical protein
VKQIVPTGDDRVLAACIYCGAAPETQDHVPSRVLLDEPFPENLPVVPSCRACNTSFSLDEEYCAALIDCITVGTAEPTTQHRPKVRKILEHHPALASVLRAARAVDVESGAVSFAPDVGRLRAIALKLARGHAAFELHTVDDEEPVSVSIAPLPLLDEASRDAFESPPAECICPEVGSRAMTRMFEHGEPSPSWIVVQPGRYRFLASPGLPLLVRLVIGEYLACEVVWGQG